MIIYVTLSCICEIRDISVVGNKSGSYYYAVFTLGVEKYLYYCNLIEK